MTERPFTPLEALDHAIAKIGSRAKLAKAIGISEQRIYQWTAREYGCSLECAPFIVAACDGAVSVFELRPGDREFFLLVRSQLDYMTAEDCLTAITA